MSSHPWDDLIPSVDLEIYQKAGYGRTFGFGQNPVLLVIDVEYGFVGAKPKDSILEAIKLFPNACGPAGWKGVSQIKTMLAAARKHRVPIIYFHTQRKPDSKPKYQGLHGNEIIKTIKPRKGDVIIAKPSFSAFFGTNLLSHLVERKIDTLIVTGCTTSGCIRATVVDGYCYKYKVIIPEECVFDRASIPHQANLFDMNAKFADVVKLANVVEYLEK